MIYTVTLNPSIDCNVRVRDFNLGMTNRTIGEDYQIGGKGINVSIILQELGKKNTALGFIAGFTGEAIELELRERGIKTDFIRLKSGISRINIKISSYEGTEINCRGPEIAESDLSAMTKKVESIHDGDTIVISGSTSVGVPEDFYADLLDHIIEKDIRIVVDTTKLDLLPTLKYKPFLIKPNVQELSEIFGVTLSNEAEIEKYARLLQDMGARNVIISLGSDGAMLVDEFGKWHRTGVLRGRVINTVGCGDSMVAGFIAGYDKNKDYEYAFNLATACGNATAFSHGLAQRKTIDDILEIITKKD